MFPAVCLDLCPDHTKQATDIEQTLRTVSDVLVAIDDNNVKAAVAHVKQLLAGKA